MEIIPTMSSSVVYAMDNEVKFYIKAHIISILNVFTILFYHLRIASIPSSKFVANEKNIIKFSLSEKATKLF